MEWVKGYENRYMINTNGNIYSFVRKRGNPLIPVITKKGYQTVKLNTINGKVKTIPIHRLVAMQFLKNPDKKTQVNHINGIKIDNRAENLEWCTNKENAIHAFKLGLKKPKRGIDHPICKLTEAQVLEIRNDVRTQKSIAVNYNINQSLVYAIKSRKIWKHI